MDHLNNVAYHLWINDHEMCQWTCAATHNDGPDEHDIKRCAHGTPTGLIRTVGIAGSEMLADQRSTRYGGAKGHHNDQAE